MINLKHTLLLGHRGARGEALENTLAGFRHAQHLQPYGLSGVEFDIQLSADGHLIIFHDDTLQRLCGVQSRVDQLGLTEINRHLQLGHHILTLADLATSAHLLTHFAAIELEIKTHSRTNYTKLVTALTRDLVDSALASLPIILTSFDVQLLAQLQRSKLLTHIPRSLLTRTPEAVASAPNTALQLGCRQLGIYYPLLDASVIEQCHRYGLPVSAWTVNNTDIIKQLIEWQVDTIITDFPTQVLLR